MSEQDRPTSAPPQARVVTAQGNAMAHVIAQLVELAIVIGAVWLRSIDKLSEENLVWVLPALIGPIASKIRGVAPAASVVTVIALLPFIKKGLLAKAIIGASLFMTGCATFGQTAVAALPVMAEVAKAAGPALVRMAEKDNAKLDVATAACFPVTDVVEEQADTDLGMQVIVCVAHEL